MAQATRAYHRARTAGDPEGWQQAAVDLADLLKTAAEHRVDLTEVLAAAAGPVTTGSAIPPGPDRD